MTKYPLYTGEEGDFRIKIGNFVIFSSIVLLLIGIRSASPIVFISLPLLSLGLRLRKSGQHLLKGYHGEVKVLEILSDIGGYVISDVVLPDSKGNIDHVFISKYGVFAIEVKNWDVDVNINGDKWEIWRGKNLVRISSISKALKKRAFELSTLIKSSTGKKIFVKPIVVFTGAGVVLGTSTVPILTPEELPKFICSEKETLNMPEIKEIVNVISKFGHLVIGGHYDD